MTWSRLARRAAKAALAGTFYYSGALRGVEKAWRAAGTRVHVLGYHRVVDDFPSAASHAIPALCVSAETFRRHMELLGEHLEIVPLSRAVDILAELGDPPTRSTATITFDDAYRDVHRHALPILRRLGIPATVFVPTGYIGSARYLPHDRLYSFLSRDPAAVVDTFSHVASSESVKHVLTRVTRALTLGGPDVATDEAVSTLPAPALLELLAALERRLGTHLPDDPGALVMRWEELRELSQSGIEIGSHTVGHVVLTNVSHADVLRELRDSKSALELQLGRPVRYFAYPNGRYDQDALSLLARVGYAAAVTTEDRPNRRGMSPYLLHRKVLWEDHGRGLTGRFSRSMSAGHLTDLFGAFGLRRARSGEEAPPAARG